MKKDLHWSILGKKYVVRNVPYEIYDAESEEDGLNEVFNLCRNSIGDVVCNYSFFLVL
jgi:hypothetical protein